MIRNHRQFLSEEAKKLFAEASKWAFKLEAESDREEPTEAEYDFYVKQVTDFACQARVAEANHRWNLRKGHPTDRGDIQFDRPENSSAS